MMQEAKAEEPAMVAVADASYQDPAPAVDRVIRELDLESWVSGLKGKKVFIKPNMLGLFPPEQHATTHPSLVRCLVGSFREAGAEVAVGDNCGVGGYGLNNRVAKKSGIAEASDGAFINVAKDTVQVPLNSRYMDSLVVSRAMMEADVLVSVPKMKTHGLTVVTGAVKNMFGLTAGACKGMAHASAPGLKEFGNILGDIFSLRPPDLTIMDAVVAMEGSGPSSGKPKQVGKIIGSKNAVALDAVMCSIMGIPPQEVHHLARASKLGHGPLDNGAIEIKGAAPSPARFKLPTTVHKMSFIGRFVNQRFFRPISRSRLYLDEKKCTKCKLCVEACPTGAMHFDQHPWIDDEVCIRCLCCHELCPEQAWSTGGLMARWRGRRF